jgi:TPR repeat protein
MVWLSDMYPDFLEETDAFTELPPWSQFFLTGLLPFLSYKELVPDWKEKSLFDLQFMLAEMPRRADLFEAYAKQGLPLTGHLPDDRGSTPIDYLIFNSIKLGKQHGEFVILNLVRLLVKLGADLKEKSKDGRSPGLNAFTTVGNYRLLDLIKELMPDIADGNYALENVSDIKNQILVLQNAKRYKEALALVTKLAEQGDVSYMVLLGFYYENGWGTAEAPEKAAVWWQKAADKNNAVAQYKLAFLYNLGRGVKEDFVKALELFKKSAQQGEVYAQVPLGDCYYHGQGVEQDYAKAVEWYRKAAEKKSEKAMFKLANCYYDGKGVKQDDALAFEWFLKAAERDYANAQAMVGDCYNEGQGVKQDKAKAIEWYKKAAAQNHEGAIEMLKELGAQ